MKCQDSPCDSYSQLQSVAESARQAAFQSMIEASEYGSLIQFIKGSFSADTPQALSNSVFEYMSSLDLNCSIQIRSCGLVETWSDIDTPADKVEQDIFEAVRHKGRMVDFKQRTIFNATNVSILVKNMPDDHEDYGRKKDVLAVLLECCEARVTGLEKQDTLKTILSQLMEAVTDLNMSFTASNNQTIDIMEHLMSNMCMAFDNLALTEEQENHFTMLVDGTMGELVAMHMENRDIEDRFIKIMDLTKASLFSTGSK